VTKGEEFRRKKEIQEFEIDLKEEEKTQKKPDLGLKKPIEKRN